MTAPINTYDSKADLFLGQIPKGADDNPDLYEELLDLHNAIEGTLIFVESLLDSFKAVITVTEDYTIQENDGTIRVDASAGINITITLPAATGSGRKYDIKKVVGIPIATVVLVGDGTQLVDERPDGIKISLKSSYTVKDIGTGWDII